MKTGISNSGIKYIQFSLPFRVRFGWNKRGNISRKIYRFNYKKERIQLGGITIGKLIICWETDENYN